MLANIQEMPLPPYPVDQPISTPSDVKQDEAAGYPTGMGPIQSIPQQLQGYPAQVACINPQQGYILQPAAYSHVSKINNYPKLYNR